MNRKFIVMKTVINCVYQEKTINTYGLNFYPKILSKKPKNYIMEDVYVHFSFGLINSAISITPMSIALRFNISDLLDFF